MPADNPRQERSFAKNASFRYMRLQSERWLSTLLANGQLEERVPTLYQAYVCVGGPSLAHTRMRPVSDFFEALDRPPARSEAATQDLAVKNSILRLLAVCVKAHYFLFKLDVLEEPPSVFWVPDLMNPARPRFGVYYPFLKSKRAVMVSEADLAQISSGKLSLGRFPVVLTHRPDRWLNADHWMQLEKEGSALRALLDAPRRGGPEAAALRATSDPQAFPFGTLFNVPEELRSIMKGAGLRWAEGAQSYYLPRGFDVDPIVEFFNFKQQEISEARDVSNGSYDEFLEEPR